MNSDVQIPDPQKTVLDNGLRVISQKIPGRTSIHLGLFILVGSRNESESLAGVAHFNEHMVFKGTRRRSAYDLVREIEAVGGELGATTGREMTNYTVQCLPKDLSLAVDILSDMVFDPNFTSDELEKERQVILSEIDMTKENFEESIFDFAFEDIFKNHSLSRPILGYENTVSSLSLEGLTSFHQEFYTPPNFVLVAVGDLEHEDLEGYAKEYSPSKNNILASNVNSIPPEFSSSHRVVKRRAEQGHVLVNFPMPAFKEKTRFYSYLMNTVLGGGMTSRLYQSLRERHGLCYTVYSYLQSFLDTGVLSIYVATKNGKELEVVGRIIDEINVLLDQGMACEDLMMYQTQITSELIMGEDELDSRMSALALHELVFEDFPSFSYAISQIEGITEEGFAGFCSKYFTQEPQITLLGSKLEE